jgi:hypothetical protein
MRITSRLALAAALLMMLSATLNAGTVQVGFLPNGFDYGKWLCGPPMPLPKLSSESKCADAKFQECSSCSTAFITNNSDAPVDVKIEHSGAGFSEPRPTGNFHLGFACIDPNGKQRPVSLPGPCGNLSPGSTCTQRLEFCPEHSGTSSGWVVAITTANSQSQTITLELTGDAIYSPELKAADEARRRHLDELMEIPHVAKVDLDPRDGKIFIKVEVEQAPIGQAATQVRIDEVRKAAPPKIEGYDVEVTEYYWPTYAY